MYTYFFVIFKNDVLNILHVLTSLVSNEAKWKKHLESLMKSFHTDYSTLVYVMLH